jgi:deoxyribose-phosphate aldolase
MTIQGKEVDTLISEAKSLGVYGVCVPPFWVKRASREVGDADLQLITVVGYPLGYQMTEVKMEEARLAIRDGATEIDVVINASSFANGMPWTKIELAKLSNYLHEEGILLKVIIETELWNEHQMSKLARMVADVGADFLKTSTGYHRKPVTPEEISFLRQQLPSNVGIKASGGVKTKAQAIALIEAGADRLGTSSASQILTP